MPHPSNQPSQWPSAFGAAPAPRWRLWGVPVLALALLGALSAARAGAAPTGSPQAHTEPVFLEDMTSFELKSLIASGVTTVLVPIGGTEQNGKHMALGKHNVRVKYLAGKIAQRLGNAVVAPVISYVPEGSINPPVAHMRFTGTISIPEATFESLLEATAKSFQQHGVRNVFFLGDHGGYQKNEVNAANKINASLGAHSGFKAFALTGYYEASQGPWIQWLRNKGFSDAAIGTHAGLSDTALMMAVDKSMVREDLLDTGVAMSPSEGVYGDPRKASAELGAAGVELIIARSVKAIQDALAASSTRK